MSTEGKQPVTDGYARERLNAIAAVLNRGIPDERKLAVINRLVHPVGRHEPGCRSERPEGPCDCMPDMVPFTTGEENER